MVEKTSRVTVEGLFTTSVAVTTISEPVAVTVSQAVTNWVIYGSEPPAAVGLIVVVSVEVTTSVAVSGWRSSSEQALDNSSSKYVVKALAVAILAVSVQVRFRLRMDSVVTVVVVPSVRTVMIVDVAESVEVAVVASVTVAMGRGRNVCLSRSDIQRACSIDSISVGKNKGLGVVVGQSLG